MIQAEDEIRAIVRRWTPHEDYWYSLWLEATDDPQKAAIQRAQLILDKTRPTPRERK